MGRADMNIDPRLRGDDDDVTSDEERQLGYNPQARDADYDPELGHERKAKKQKLQQRFENIFEKYGRDFDGIGDEIDLKTGLIVVDNGHLKNMRHEADIGRNPWSEDLETSAENLEHSDNVDDAGDSGSDGGSEGGFDENEGRDLDEDDSASGNTNSGWFSAREQSADSATSVSAPESGLLIGSKGSPSRITRVNQRSRTRTATEPIENFLPGIEEAAAAPDDILEQIPSLRASMLDIQMKQRSGQSMNQDAIQELGMNIASQLANFVNQNNHQTPKPKRDNVKDPLWSYPDLPQEQDYEPQHKKRRTRSPSPFPYYTGPSPGQKSLWAPMSHPRPRKKYKRRNQDPEAQILGQEGSESFFITENGGSVPEPISQTDGDGPRKCYNCQCSDSLIWRTGPDGILCNACGMYYYRYGLIRPLEPQPESDESEMSDDSDPEIEGLGDLSSHLLKESKNIRFRMQEDALLIRLKEIDRLSWENIAKHLPGRTAYGVQCRYSKKLHARPVEARAYLVNQGYDFRHDENGVISFTPAPQAPSGWTEEDDDLLLKLREGDGLDWEQVVVSFPGRTARAMEKRYKYLARKYAEGKSGRPKRKGKKRADPATRLFMRYSEEEDELLLKLREVEKLSWIELAQRFPGRNAMALQKRYVRELAYKNKDIGVDPLAVESGIFLRSNPLKYSRYIGEEDEMLLRLRDDLGMDWKEIQEKMPGRKSQSLENRYQYLKMKDTLPQSQANGASATPDAEGAAHPINGNVDGRSDDELMQDTEELSFGPEHTTPSTQPDHPSGIESSIIDDLTALIKEPQTAGVDTTLIAVDKFTVMENNLTIKPQEASNLPTPMSSGAHIFALTAIASKRGLRWTKEESDMVFHLHEQGWSFDQLATQMPWRTRTAIKIFYNTTFGKNAKRKSFPPPLKGEPSLLRQAVDNYMRRCTSTAVPPVNTSSALIDLATHDASYEASAVAEDELEMPNSEVRPQADGLLPSALPRDIHDAPYQVEVEEVNHAHKASRRSTSPHVRPRSASPQYAIESEAMFRHFTSTLTGPPNHNYGEFSTSLHPETPYRFLEDPQRSSEPTGARTTANYFTPIRHNHQTHPYYIVPPSHMYIPSPNDQQPEQETHVKIKVVTESSIAQPARQPNAVATTSRRVTRSSTRSAAAKVQPALVKPVKSDASDILAPNVAPDDATGQDVERILHEELINDHEPTCEAQSANEIESFTVQENVDEEEFADDPNPSSVPEQQTVARRKSGRAPKLPQRFRESCFQDSEDPKVEAASHEGPASDEDSASDEDPATDESLANDKERDAADEQLPLRSSADLAIMVLSDPDQQGVGPERREVQQGQKRGSYISDHPKSTNSPANLPRRRGRPRKNSEETQPERMRSARSPYRTRMTLRADAEKVAEEVHAMLAETREDSVPDDELPESRDESPLPEVSCVEAAAVESSSDQEITAAAPEGDLKQSPIQEAGFNINREPESTSGMSNAEDDEMDGIDPLQEGMSELSQMSETLLSSSSPILSMKTPGSVYGKTATPGTDRSTLFGRPQHRGVAALRSSFGGFSARSRSSSVALPDSTKRVVYTPVRDVDGSEDELS